MIVIKKGEKFPLREMVHGIYGEPGVGKTTLATTAKDVLFFDLETGADRADIQAKTTVRGDWIEIRQVIQNGQLAKWRQEHDILVVDTAEALLTETIGKYLKTSDRKYSNDLKYYGKMKELFEFFVNSVLALKFDLVFVNHHREAGKKYGDNHSRFVPRMTGGAREIFLAKVDMLGYMYVKGGKRILSFNTNDSFASKNPARVEDIHVPHYMAEGFETFFRDKVINPAKLAIIGRGTKKASTLEVKPKTPEKVKEIKLSKTVKNAWAKKFKEVTAENFNELLPKLSSLNLTKEGKDELWKDVIVPNAKRLNLKRAGATFILDPNSEPKAKEGKGETVPPKQEMSNENYAQIHAEFVKKYCAGLRQLGYPDTTIPDVTYTQMEMMAKVPTIKFSSSDYESVSEEVFQKLNGAIIDHLREPQTES